MQIIQYTTAEGTSPYQKWVNGLRDLRARVAILRRLDRTGGGNFGDHKPCREGICELRIPEGAGYRVYYFMHGQTLVVLVCGGDKSTQGEDIRKALVYKADYLRRMEEHSYE